jgi:hypothetical protein
LTQLGLTIAAADRHGWKIILLGKESKRPIGSQWIVTEDISTIQSHGATKGNIGVVCGSSHIAVLDFDNLDAMRALFNELGELEPWVETGSYKFHCYVKWVDNLPAKILHEGVTVGEVQRGNQYVVMPPSIHPVTRAAYRWLVDPTKPLPDLPETWLKYLSAPPISAVDVQRPAYIASDDRRGVPSEEPWEGPSADVLLQRALEQPGARRRRNGIKFQCAGCVAEGHDKSRDNAIVYLDGRWGCAVGGAAHRRAIATQLRVPIGMPIHGTASEVLPVFGEPEAPQGAIFADVFEDPDNRLPVFLDGEVIHNG